MFDHRQYEFYDRQARSPGQADERFIFNNRRDARGDIVEHLIGYCLLPFGAPPRDHRSN
jgi:hypothetical protein